MTLQVQGATETCDVCVQRGQEECFKDMYIIQISWTLHYIAVIQVHHIHISSSYSVFIYIYLYLLLLQYFDGLHQKPEPQGLPLIINLGHMHKISLRAPNNEISMS